MNQVWTNARFGHVCEGTEAYQWSHTAKFRARSFDSGIQAGRTSG